MENEILTLLQKVGDVVLASLCALWVESSVVDVEARAEMQVPPIEAPSAAILRGSDGPTLSSSMAFPSSLSLCSAPWAWPICSKALLTLLLLFSDTDAP